MEKAETDANVAYQVNNNGQDMPDDKIKEVRRAHKKYLKDQILAMEVLQRSDKRRYGNLLIEMGNNYVMGQNKYPDTTKKTLELLNKYTPPW